MVTDPDHRLRTYPLSPTFSPVTKNKRWSRGTDEFGEMSPADSRQPGPARPATEAIEAMTGRPPGTPGAVEPGPVDPVGAPWSGAGGVAQAAALRR